MKIQCPDCSRELRIEAELVGKRVRCPCGREMIVGKPASQKQAPQKARAASQPPPESEDQDPDWPPPEYRDLFSSQEDRELEQGELPRQVARPTGPGARPTLRRQMSAAEKCRREYSRNEAGVINTGFYFVLISVTLLMLAVPLFPELDVLRDASNPEVQKKALAAMYLSLGVAACSIFLWVIGLGLRNYQNWARRLAIVLIFPLYFAFPVGSIAAGFLIASINSQEAKFIFSQKHQQARRFTPQLRPRHSAFSWIVAGIFAFVIFGSAAWLFSVSLMVR